MFDHAEQPAIQPAPAVLVRPARRAEYDAIRTLLRTGYHGYTTDIDWRVWPVYLADLLDLDRHARHGVLLVAVIDGDIAGYAAFYPDASLQRLGWPAGWAGGRGLVVHPGYRRFGVAAALLSELERRGHVAGAAAFAFHTSSFMTAAIPLYERLGYRRAPEFDIDMNTHYGSTAAKPWTAIAYCAVCRTQPDPPQLTEPFATPNGEYP